MAAGFRPLAELEEVVVEAGEGEEEAGGGGVEGEVGVWQLIDGVGAVEVGENAEWGEGLHGV